MSEPKYKDIIKNDGKDVGARVLIFDHLLFKNDIDTPLSMTIKPATVIRRYEYTSPYFGLYPDLVDVRFDHIRVPHFKGEERYISKGHFTKEIDIIK